MNLSWSRILREGFKVTFNCEKDVGFKFYDEISIEIDEDRIIQNYTCITCDYHGTIEYYEDGKRLNCDADEIDMHKLLICEKCKKRENK